jgi:hypothetical protein
MTERHRPTGGRQPPATVTVRLTADQIALIVVCLGARAAMLRANLGPPRPGEALLPEAQRERYVDDQAQLDRVFAALNAALLEVGAHPVAAAIGPAARPKVVRRDARGEARMA